MAAADGDRIRRPTCWADCALQGRPPRQPQRDAAGEGPRVDDQPDSGDAPRRPHDRREAKVEHAAASLLRRLEEKNRGRILDAELGRTAEKPSPPDRQRSGMCSQPYPRSTAVGRSRVRLKGVLDAMTGWPTKSGGDVVMMRPADESEPANQHLPHGRHGPAPPPASAETRCPPELPAPAARLARPTSRYAD